MFSHSLVKTLLSAFAITLIILFCGESSFASEVGAGEVIDPNRQTQILQRVMIALMMIMLLAKLGGDLMLRLGQPAVLGELLFGILLGNVALFSPSLAESLQITAIFHDSVVSEFVTLLSEVGVMLLLFEVGLESTVREMMSVGASAFLVAVLGVITPVALGFGVGEIFLKGEPYTVHLFLGAVLAATSVGITARVISDLGQMHRRESKIILGAAVIDDVLGLIVMAIAIGMVNAVNQGGSVDIMSLGMIVVKSLAFFVVAMFVGGIFTRHLFRLAGFLRGAGVLLTCTLIWMFFMSWFATYIGLASIVGAFAAGLVLEDLAVHNIAKREQTTLAELLRPLSAFLVPVFFVRMGMQVDLSTFAQKEILLFAGVLTLAAILGKQVCGLGVLERGLDRLVIGVGMIPRGEVGLIVAGLGATMKTAEGHPVINSATFSASVIMVIVTTMITPPLLTWLFKREKKRPAVKPSVSDL